MKNLLITIACDYDYYELPCVYSVYLMIFFILELIVLKF